MNKLLSIDIKLTHKFAQYRLLLDNPIIHLFLISGNQSGFIIVVLFFYFAYNATLLQLVVLIGLMIILTAFLMLIKPLFNRQRPFPELAPSTHYFDNFSFPSGHASRIGALFAFAVLLYPPSFWLILLVIWGLIIACSRVVKGVHYFSDVVGGLIIAFSVAIPLLLIVRVYI